MTTLLTYLNDDCEKVTKSLSSVNMIIIGECSVFLWLYTSLSHVSMVTGSYFNSNISNLSMLYGWCVFMALFFFHFSNSNPRENL